MAIYGLNVNGTAIPEAMQRKFTPRLKRNKHTGALYPAGKTGKADFVLQAVAQSPEERDAVLVQMNNGHRQIHVVERKTAAAPWFGIYTG